MPSHLRPHGSRLTQLGGVFRQFFFRERSAVTAKLTKLTFLLLTGMLEHRIYSHFQGEEEIEPTQSISTMLTALSQSQYGIVNQTFTYSHIFSDFN